MMRRLFALYRNLFRRKRVDQELEEELRSYIELVAGEEADDDARLELAHMERIKESIRDSRTGASLDILLQDVRYGIRTFVRNPGFAILAVFTLALAIGANTTIFTVVNGVLLEPLPYSEPDRLVLLWERHISDNSLETVSPGNFTIGANKRAHHSPRWQLSIRIRISF